MDLLINNPKYLYLINYKYSILKLSKKKFNYFEIILLLINNNINNMIIKLDINISSMISYCKKYDYVEVNAIKCKIFDYIINKNDSLFNILQLFNKLIYEYIIYNYSLYDIELIYLNLVNIINQTEILTNKEYIRIIYIDKQYKNLIYKDNYYLTNILKIFYYYNKYNEYNNSNILEKLII